MPLGIPIDPPPRGPFVQGVAACLPTVLGYWSIGFAAGGVGTLAGFSIPDILLLAGLLYAGSAQFLVYGMTAAGAGPLAIAVAILLVNVRYLLMSAALAPYFRGQTPLQKCVGGALLTDETFAVASGHAARHGALPFRWLLGVNVTAYLNWIAANGLGAVLARTLPAAVADGLSFGLTAMFVGLLLLTVLASRSRASDLVCVAVAASAAAAALAILPPNVALLVGAVAGATAATAATATRTAEVR